MLSFKFNYMIEIIVLSLIIGIVFSLFYLPQKKVLFFNKNVIKLFILVLSLIGGFLFVYTLSSHPILGPFLIGYLISYLFFEAIFSRTEVFFLISFLFFLSYFGLNRINFILTLFFILSYTFDYYFFKTLKFNLKKNNFYLTLRLFLRRHIKKINILSKINFIFLFIIFIYSYLSNNLEVIVSSFLIISMKEITMKFLSSLIQE